MRVIVEPHSPGFAVRETEREMETETETETKTKTIELTVLSEIKF